jgi:hypothetical protein
MQSIKSKNINNSKVYITCKINWFKKKNKNLDYKYNAPTILSGTIS